MNHLLAQHDLEAVLTSLVSLVPFLSGKSCEEGTSVLVKLLGEALEAQEAALTRAGELKKLKPKDLMVMFAPENGKDHPKAIAPPPARVSVRKPQPSAKVEEAEKAVIARPQPVPQPPKTKVVARKRATLQDEEEEEEAAAGAAAAQELREQAALERELKAAKRMEPRREAWNGMDYPRITKIVRCDNRGGAFQVLLYAKRSGRGEMPFLIVFVSLLTNAFWQVPGSSRCSRWTWRSWRRLTTCPGTSRAWSRTRLEAR